MRFDNIKQAVHEAQEDLESIIVDPSLSLDKRWDLWIDAPDYLKNVSGDLFDLKNTSLTLYTEVKRQDFHRYQTVQLEFFEDDPVREEILKRNLYAVIYDW